jgi:1-acyl-sn-glycerol-3-phosphate acyltransferase
VLVYRLVMALAVPIVRWWGRLDVRGENVVPATGPTVLMANHDSPWDPLIIGVALRKRQIRALAKASLWRFRPAGWVLDHMGQLPIERGRGDLAAMSAAVTQLERGECIGVFPEGTLSRGEALRPLSGAGRLVLAVPDSCIVCVSVTGAVELARFPRRPRIRVEFFEPSGGQASPDESAIRLTRRVMAEIRQRAPYAAAGR